MGYQHIGRIPQREIEINRLSEAHQLTVDDDHCYKLTTASCGLIILYCQLMLPSIIIQFYYKIVHAHYNFNNNII
jgi:hypothetical protein